MKETPRNRIRCAGIFVIAIFAADYFFFFAAGFFAAGFAFEAGFFAAIVQSPSEIRDRNAATACIND